MKDYIILTDSSCDLTPEQYSAMDVRYTDLLFRFDGEDKEYTNRDLSGKAFYDCLRAGKVSRTAAINVGGFTEFFKNELEKGLDVLYLGFSSGLSNTYNAARMAADELRGQYPEQTIITIDTLCASAGEGLLVYLCSEKKKAGADIEEVAAYARNLIPHLSHWFTADDLMYLMRGGRVSATAAIAGTVLAIKPVLHVDDEGKLISMSKVRGRKASLKALADKLLDTQISTGDGIYYISHADCLEDALFVEEQIYKKTGKKAASITDIGAVIGSHTGPGVVALFFIGQSR